MSVILDEYAGHTEAQILETQLGLPQGFLSDLIKESDWTFIIKIESFLEGVLSHILTETIGKPVLQEVFTHLDMGNKKAGKIAVSYKLKLLRKQDREFLDALIELRNQFAHNIIFVNSTIKDYLQSLKTEQMNYFFNKLIMYFAYIIPTTYFNTPESQETMTQVKEIGRKQPKIAIWLSVMTFIERLYQRKQTQIALNKLRQEMYWATKI